MRCSSLYARSWIARGEVCFLVNTWLSCNVIVVASLSVTFLPNTSLKDLCIHLTVCVDYMASAKLSLVGTSTRGLLNKLDDFLVGKLAPISSLTKSQALSQSILTSTAELSVFFIVFRKETFWNCRHENGSIWFVRWNLHWTWVSIHFNYWLECSHFLKCFEGKSLHVTTRQG